MDRGPWRGGGWDRNPPPSRRAGDPKVADKTGWARPTRFGSVLVSLTVLAVLVPGAVDPGLRSVVLVVGGGLLAIGLLGSWPPRRMRVAVTGAPTATVGTDARYEVRVSGVSRPVLVRLLDPTGPWATATPDVPVDLWRPTDRRGIHAGVRVQVAVDGPLGVMRRSRSQVVRLPAIQHVGPRPLRVRPAVLPAPTAGAVAEAAAATTAPGDVVRSVRPYAFGDPAHLVHWPSTARRGEVVGSSRVDLQACKLEYSIVSPK